jgi:NAD-dependent deacetylase
MDQNIAKLQQWIDESQRIVFFGGAGVSTESGIPDFRSVDGLYNQTYDYPPETILSHTFFEKNPGEFYKFYRDKMLIDGAKPNPAHLKLAELEQAGKLTAVVTQNIDGLHQAAGSKAVFELHGSTLRNHCTRCGRKYPASVIAQAKTLPYCTNGDCHGIIRPDVVLYEEALDQDVMAGAISAIRKADMLIIGGTSLVVYPAAGLVNYYSGHKLVLINKSPTTMDNRADLAINAPIGEVFAQIQVR